MKSEKQIKARIEGIKEAIADNSELMKDKDNLEDYEYSALYEDNEQLLDRQRILEWVLN